MMGGLAALERSEQQWRELLEGTGVEIARFWFPPGGSIDGVVEVMLGEGEDGVLTNGNGKGKL